MHIFTAMGAGIALLAMLEAVREHWASMFGWLGVALIIDAIDGPLARRLDVVGCSRTGRARCSISWSIS